MLMGRKPTVGGEHSEFAEDITAYLVAIKGDQSVRSVAADHPVKGLTWWSTIFNGRNALTTDDIAMVANLLGVNPYDFVREAREFKRTGMRPLRTFNVGTPDEAYELSEFPAHLADVAEEERRPDED
jgi:hypothetical protein